MSELFILAGEASGDLHGGRLCAALCAQRPDLKLFGVPGPRMRAHGVEPVLQTEDLAIMGFTDVIKALPRLRRQLHLLTHAIMTRRPSLVVLIDYGGLNLRLAKRLRKAGYAGKIVQYISPKVWAWGRHRIKTMAQTLDLLLTIFPFEAIHFADTPLRVEYVGNPLIQEQAEYSYAPASPSSTPLIGLFPGSRPAEIRLNARHHLAAAALLKQQWPEAQFALSVASPKVGTQLKELVASSPLEITLFPPGTSYDLMSQCTAALATSGTVNLELALHRVPHVVVYRCSHLNAALARLIFRINLPHYSIANFVHGDTFLPELIYTQFTPKRACRALGKLLQNPAACLAGCDRVRTLLATDHPSARAAQFLLELLPPTHRGKDPHLPSSEAIVTTN